MMRQILHKIDFDKLLGMAVSLGTPLPSDTNNIELADIIKLLICQYTEQGLPKFEDNMKETTETYHSSGRTVCGREPTNSANELHVHQVNCDDQ